MTFDRAELAGKLKRYRDQFIFTVEDVAKATGIEVEVLKRYEAGGAEPTGDDILILADLYKCDFKFFISNEKKAPFEQTETLFRRLGKQLSKADRWSIQEFLYLCECEQQLFGLLGVRRSPFTFMPTGGYFKKHGEDGAAALRTHLGYAPLEVARDVFADFRRLGLHVFRRELENSTISGLCVQHPVAGTCLLVNYSEDVYRQRFTAAHEAAHAVLDAAEGFVVDGEEIVTSTRSWARSDLVEVRAHTFASHYLLPHAVLATLPDPETWSVDQAVEWANRLRVNSEALAIALAAAERVSSQAKSLIASSRVPRHMKEDPELPPSLTPRQRQRREALLRRGLSSRYVDLAFEAYERGHISRGRLAEMLLTTDRDLAEVAEDLGRSLARGDHA